jgi:hypothetical protein
LLARHRGVPLLLVLLVAVLLLFLVVVHGARRSRGHGGHTRNSNTKRAKGPSKQATQVLQEKVRQVPLAPANLLHQLPVPPLNSTLGVGSSAGGGEGAQETIQRRHVSCEAREHLQLRLERCTREGPGVLLQDNGILQKLVTHLRGKTSV